MPIFDSFNIVNAITTNLKNQKLKFFKFTYHYLFMSLPFYDLSDNKMMLKFNLK